MSKRITEVITWDSLDSGYFTPSHDVMIGSGVAVSNPTIKFTLIDLDPAHTREAGAGCYKRLYFDTEFEGDLTVVYTPHQTVRKDSHMGALDVGVKEVSYNKLFNKSSVVEDTTRDDISFHQVLDIDALAARYIMLQQFSGKRLTSQYVIARAMDDYFENYYGKVNINLRSGTVEADIPWIRLNVSTGNRLVSEADNELSLYMNGVLSTLSPSDDALNTQYAEAIVPTTDKVSQAQMNLVVSTINSRFGGRAHSSDITPESIVLDDSRFMMMMGNSSEQVESWEYSKGALEDLSDAISDIRDKVDSVEAMTAHNGLEKRLRGILNDTAGRITYTMNSIAGNTLSINGVTQTYPGAKHVSQVNALLNKKDNYLIPSEYLDVVEDARKIAKGILPTGYTPVNKSASTLDEMINFLA